MSGTNFLNAPRSNISSYTSPKFEFPSTPKNVSGYLPGKNCPSKYKSGCRFRLQTKINR